MAARERMIAMGFNPDDLDLADLFVGLVANILEADRRNAAALRRGITKLAMKMNSLVPEFEEHGRTEPIKVNDLVEAMKPLPDDSIQSFIEIAGSIMLTSQDGPMASAPSMKRVIDELEAHRDGGAK